MVIKATIIKILFAEIYVNVVFVIRCLFNSVSLTLVKECFIRIVYYDITLSLFSALSHGVGTSQISIKKKIFLKIDCRQNSMTFLHWCSHVLPLAHSLFVTQAVYPVLGKHAHTLTHFPHTFSTITCSPSWLHSSVYDSRCALCLQPDTLKSKIPTTVCLVTHFCHTVRTNIFITFCCYTNQILKQLMRNQAIRANHETAKVIEF